MKVLVYEDNMMWSARLMNSLQKLGHEAQLVQTPEARAADAAIVNLGSENLDPVNLVPALKEIGVVVIGHAGHKEKDLLSLGREAGCQIVATNGELTYKIEALLERART
jgi:hypothetical protein